MFQISPCKSALAIIITGILTINGAVSVSLLGNIFIGFDYHLEISRYKRAMQFACDFVFLTYLEIIMSLVLAVQEQCDFIPSGGSDDTKCHSAA